MKSEALAPSANTHIDPVLPMIATLCMSLAENGLVVLMTAMTTFDAESFKAPTWLVMESGLPEVKAKADTVMPSRVQCLTILSLYAEP